MNRHSRPLPAFGRMPLDRIGPEDVAAWFDAATKDKPGAANRAFEILRATMFRAEERGLRERGSNPCLGIAKNPRNHFARFLDADELARLGRALANDAALRAGQRPGRRGRRRAHRRSDGGDHEQNAPRTGACTMKASICNRRCGVSLDQSAWDRKAQC